MDILEILIEFNEKSWWRGEIEKTLKMDTLNWEFLNFRRIIEKTTTIQGG